MALTGSHVWKALLLAALTLLISCGEQPRKLESAPREVVLSDGMKLSAVTVRYGTLSIAYVDPLTRAIQIDGYAEGFKRTVVMRTRPERFSGSWTIGKGILGIYNPGDSRELPRGAQRLVYQEAEKHFSSSEEMERFLIQGSAVFERVCTTDGIVIGISVTPARNQIGIEVWRLYEKGSKPKLDQSSTYYSIGVKQLSGDEK